MRDKLMRIILLAREIMECLQKEMDLSILSNMEKEWEMANFLGEIKTPR